MLIDDPHTERKVSPEARAQALAWSETEIRGRLASGGSVTITSGRAPHRHCPHFAVDRCCFCGKSQ